MVRHNSLDMKRYDLDFWTGMQERWALGMVEIAHQKAELDQYGASVTRYR